MSGQRKIQTWPTLEEDLPLVIQRPLGESNTRKKPKKKQFGSTWTSERITIGNVAAYEGAQNRWDSYINKQANINVSDPYMHHHSNCWGSEPNLVLSKGSIRLNRSSSGSSISSAGSSLLELEQAMQPRRRQSITPLEMVHTDPIMLNQPELDFGYQDIQYQPNY